jgi:hypothetical protein
LKEKILNISAYSTASDCDRWILNSKTIQSISAFQSLGWMCGTYGRAHPDRRGIQVIPETIHWLISRHLTFSTIVESYALSVMEQFVGQEFIGIHVRLGDYKGHHCKTISFCPQINDVVKCIQRLGIYTVFLATNPGDLFELRSKLLNTSRQISVHDSSNLGIPSEFLSTVEQAVCKRATVFIGSNTSSWSQLVFDLRDAASLRVNKSLTWNRCVS